MSIVDEYLMLIKEQKLAKKLERNGLDPGEHWISVNALVLLGCLNCTGSDKDKAEVFLRVVAPEMGMRILVSDNDIRLAIFFLTNLSTILLHMTTKQVRETLDD